MPDLLRKYRQMRDFSDTPEPAGGTPKKSKLPIFVIQKHRASHLHYDFRLEMEGVLKSWAIPKGPSYDPGTRRLAMMTEDHPYDYASFDEKVDVTAVAPRSVISNKLVEEVGGGKVWESNRKAASRKAPTLADKLSSRRPAASTKKAASKKAPSPAASVRSRSSRAAATTKARTTARRRPR